LIYKIPISNKVKSFHGIYISLYTLNNQAVGNETISGNVISYLQQFSTWI